MSYDNKKPATSVERKSLSDLIGHFVYCDASLYDFLYKLYPSLSILTKPQGSNFISFVPSLSPQLASLISARHSNFICLSTSYADLQITVSDVAALALDFAIRFRGCRKRKVSLPSGKEFKVISSLIDFGTVQEDEESFPAVFDKVGTTHFAQEFLAYANTNTYATRSVATFIGNVYQTATTGVGSNFLQRASARLRSKIVFLPGILDSHLGDYADNDLLAFVFFHNSLFKVQ